MYKDALTRSVRAFLVLKTQSKPRRRQLSRSQFAVDTHANLEIRKCVSISLWPSYL